MKKKIIPQPKNTFHEPYTWYSLPNNGKDEHDNFVKRFGKFTVKDFEKAIENDLSSSYVCKNDDARDFGLNYVIKNNKDISIMTKMLEAFSNILKKEFMNYDFESKTVPKDDDKYLRYFCRHLRTMLLKDVHDQKFFEIKARIAQDWDNLIQIKALHGVKNPKFFDYSNGNHGSFSDILAVYTAIRCDKKFWNQFTGPDALFGGQYAGYAFSTFRKKDFEEAYNNYFMWDVYWRKQCDFCVDFNMFMACQDFKKKGYTWDEFDNKMKELLGDELYKWAFEEVNVKAFFKDDEEDEDK